METWNSQGFWCHQVQGAGTLSKTYIKLLKFWVKSWCLRSREKEEWKKWENENFVGLCFSFAGCRVNYNTIMNYLKILDELAMHPSHPLIHFRFRTKVRQTKRSIPWRRLKIQMSKDHSGRLGVLFPDGMNHEKYFILLCECNLMLLFKKTDQICDQFIFGLVCDFCLVSFTSWSNFSPYHIKTWNCQNSCSENIWEEFCGFSLWRLREVQPEVAFYL